MIVLGSKTLNASQLVGPMRWPAQGRPASPQARPRHGAPSGREPLMSEPNRTQYPNRTQPYPGTTQATVPSTRPYRAVRYGRQRVPLRNRNQKPCQGTAHVRISVHPTSLWAFGQRLGARGGLSNPNTSVKALHSNEL